MRSLVYLAHMAPKRGIGQGGYGADITIGNDRSSGMFEEEAAKKARGKRGQPLSEEDALERGLELVDTSRGGRKE